MHRQLSEDAAGASRQLLQTATQPIREASSNATALEMLSDSDRSPVCVPPTLEGWTRDFQSRVRSFGAPAYVPSPDNTLAVIPVSAISVVARPAITAIDSPHLRGGGRVIGEPAPILPGDPTGWNMWDFGGNRRENLVGKWEWDRISPKPAPGSRLAAVRSPLA